MVQSPTRELVNFVEKTVFDDVPTPVVEKTKRVLLDSIGCALGGNVVDRSKLALEFIEDAGGKPQATVIGRHKTLCAHAAFVNAELMGQELMGLLTIK
jgi:2-methylcitrate dehydratase PrpD